MPLVDSCCTDTGSYRKLISRQAVAVDSTRHKAYVVDTDADTIWGIDTATQASTKISVGKSPIAIGIDVQGGKVYVLNTEGASVSVVGTEATNAVVKTVNVGERPYSLAVDPQSSKVIVSNVYSDQLTIIDGATFTITTRKLGSFDAMTVNAKTDTFYLLSYEGGGLVALNGTEGASRKFSTGQMHIWGLATDDSRNILYVTHIETQPRGH